LTLRLPVWSSVVIPSDTVLVSARVDWVCFEENWYLSKEKH
jgi:hypothetical protein